MTPQPKPQSRSQQKTRLQSNTLDEVFEKGVDAAVERMKADFTIEDEELRHRKPEITKIIIESGENCHQRFVLLFVELWAIAQGVRRANNEPPLSEKQISEFLSHSTAFFNCFIHPNEEHSQNV